MARRRVLSDSGAADDSVTFYLPPDADPSSAEAAARTRVEAAGLVPDAISSTGDEDSEVLRVRVETSLGSRVGSFSREIPGDALEALSSEGRMLVRLGPSAALDSPGRLLSGDPISKVYEITSPGPVTYHFQLRWLLGPLVGIAFLLVLLNLLVRRLVRRIAGSDQDQVEKVHRLQRLGLGVGISIPLLVLPLMFLGGMPAPGVLLGEVAPDAPEAVTELVTILFLFAVLVGGIFRLLSRLSG